MPRLKNYEVDISIGYGRFSVIAANEDEASKDAWSNVPDLEQEENISFSDMCACGEPTDIKTGLCTLPAGTCPETDECAPSAKTSACLFDHDHAANSADCQFLES